jgi:hypothetical protein
MAHYYAGPPYGTDGLRPYCLVLSAYTAYSYARDHRVRY